MKQYEVHLSNGFTVKVFAISKASAARLANVMFRSFLTKAKPEQRKPYGFENVKPEQIPGISLLTNGITEVTHQIGDRLVPA